MPLETFRSIHTMNYRVKAIPEQLKCFLYGFNVFKHEANRNTAVRTFKALQNRYNYRKDAKGADERRRKRQLGDSVSKVMSRIKAHKKSKVTIKVRHIEKFLTRKKSKTVLSI